MLQKSGNYQIRGSEKWGQEDLEIEERWNYTSDCWSHRMIRKTITEYLKIILRNITPNELQVEAVRSSVKILKWVIGTTLGERSFRVRFMNHNSSLKKEVEILSSGRTSSHLLQPANGDNNQWRSRKNCSVCSQIFSRSSILKYTQTNSLGEVVQVFLVFEGFSSAIWFMHTEIIITMTIHTSNVF